MYQLVTTSMNVTQVKITDEFWNGISNVDVDPLEKKDDRIIIFKFAKVSPIRVHLLIIDFEIDGGQSTSRHVIIEIKDGDFECSTNPPKTPGPVPEGDPDLEPCNQEKEVSAGPIVSGAAIVAIVLGGLVVIIGAAAMLVGVKHRKGERK
jgi:hypothetical protein